MSIVIPTLERKLENMYGSRASLVREVHLQERINGHVLWAHDVLVYEFAEPRDARFCYAWQADDRIVTVLGVPPIRSATDAVQSHLREQNSFIARRRVLAFAPPRGRAPARRTGKRPAARVEAV